VFANSLCITAEGIGLLIGLTVAVVPSVSLVSQAFQPPLCYLGVYLELLNCLIAAVVSAISIVSHVLLFNLHYNRGSLGLLIAAVVASVIPGIPSPPTLFTLPGRIFGTVRRRHTTKSSIFC